MEKVTKYKTKQGKLFDTEKEAIQVEASDDLVHWIEINCEGINEDDNPDIYSAIVEDISYLVTLVSKIKEK